MRKYFVKFALVFLFQFVFFHAFSQDKEELSSNEMRKYNGQDYPNITIDLHAERIYILNGKIVEKNPIEGLKDEEIESIVIYSKEESVEKYGEKGKNGVIEVVTK